MDYLRQDGFAQSEIDKSVEEYFIQWFQEYVRLNLAYAVNIAIFL